MRRLGRRLLGHLLAAAIVAACQPEAVPVDAVDQPAQPAMSCVGVPPSICQQMLDDARRNAQPGAVVVQLHIRCTKPPCTLRSGEAESNVVYSDGSSSGMGMGWEGAAPAPGVP